MSVSVELFEITMGKNNQVSCNIGFNPMRTDHVSRHMKLHVKYSPDEASKEEMCQDIVVILVDNDVDEMKRKHNEAFEIDESSLRIEQTIDYKQKIILGGKVYKLLREEAVEENALVNWD